MLSLLINNVKKQLKNDFTMIKKMKKEICYKFNYIK